MEPICIEINKAEYIVSNIGSCLTPMYIKRKRAIKLIKNGIIPTLGSEADIAFWNDVVFYISHIM